MRQVTRLLRLIDQQLVNYEHLHDLLAKKRTAIEDNDLPALARAAQEIEQLIGENSRLEELRQVEARAVAGALGVPGRRPKLSHLLARLPEAERVVLEDRRERLHAALRDLKAESQTIDRVLQLNLHLIDQLMRGMLTAVPAAATYESTGAASERDTLRLLDRRV